jgi:gag-polypeptide of LTR copia-type
MDKIEKLVFVQVLCKLDGFEKMVVPT